MDPTRTMPRVGFLVAVLLSATLVVPATGAAASNVRRETLPPPSSALQIHYSDAIGATDHVVLTPVVDALDQQVIRFTRQPGGADLDSNGNPCNGSIGQRECVADNSSRILIESGGGDDIFDLSALPGPGAPLTEERDIPSSIFGGTGADDITGSPNEDLFEGGDGDDTLRGLAGPDRFAGGGGRDALLLTTGGPWTVSLDGVPNDGLVASPTAGIDADVEVLTGGPLGDMLTGGVGAQTIAGGAGGDTLDGGPGADEISGDAGADTILARDGAIDQIACGADIDTVTADWNDVVLDAAACETLTRSVRDDDGDGSPNGTDCDDTNTGIKPGGGDIPGNAVDENCDGVDSVLDRDGDGAAAGADCDDANAARRPGAIDVPGNAVDENCDGLDAAFPTVVATVASGWKVLARWTVLTSLVVRGAPAGASVEVRCAGKGCPFARRSVAVRPDGTVSLSKRFKGRRLRPGAVVEVRVLAPDAVAKVLRIAIRRRKEPKRTTLCLPPGAAKPAGCG